jgi:capsular exopolysaccharide synthesis family protein
MPTGLTPTEGVGGAVVGSPRPLHGTDVPRWNPEATEQPGTNIIRLVRRHTLLVAACAIVAGAAGMFVTARLPRLYEASVAIRVDEKAPQATAIGAPNYSRDNALGTEVEMLRSRELALAVVDSLGLRLAVAELGSGAGKPVSRSMAMSDVRVRADAPPMWYKLVQVPDGGLELQDSSGSSVVRPSIGEMVRVGGIMFRLAPGVADYVPLKLAVLTADEAADALRRSVSPGRRSRDADLIDVQVRGNDPVLVRDIANAYGRLYVATHQSARQLEAKHSVAFLGEQLDRVSRQLDSAEHSLESYRTRAGAINLTEEASTGVSRRGELLAQRNAIDAERDALDRLVRSTRAGESSRGADHYRELLAFPTLLRSGAASGLQSALSAAEQKRSDLLTRRTERDEEVKATEARIAELHGQIRDFAMTYLQGLTNQVDALDATLSRSDAALSTLPQKELRQSELERAAKTTEAVYAMLQDRYKEAEIAAAATDASIRLVDEAVLPRRPVSPKPLLNLVLAMLAGLMIGVGGAFLRDSSDRSLRTRAQLLALTGSPVLSLIPRLKSPSGFSARFPGLLTRTGGQPQDSRRGDGSSHSVVRQSRSPVTSYSAEDLFSFAASYSRLVTNLGFAGFANPIRVVLVASALPGDGKTTVATNLALTIAREGKRVLLIDADLRGGRIDTMLRLPVGAGLGEVLRGQHAFEAAVRQVPAGDGRVMHVLPRGTAKADPAALLASDKPREVLARARELYDMIILDTPPVNAVADAALLSRQCDGVLVVARAGVTARDALVFAMEQLRIVHAPVIGAVLNDVDLRGDAGVDGAYQYYGRYTPSGSVA